MTSFNGGGRGCLVLIIDESSVMQQPLARAGSLAGAAAKTKADSVATAVNSLLQKLATGPAELPLAIIGYRAGDDGRADIGFRWSGALAGSGFVTPDQWRDTPLRVEQRERSRGGQSECVDFPVWYEPHLAGKAPQVAAFQFCREILAEWQATASAGAAGPVIIHVSAGASDDGNPKQAVDSLMQMSGWATPPLVFHAYLGSHDKVPPTFLPANRAYLSLGPIRDLFERSSELPSHLADALKASGVTVLRGARGMVYNARLLELVQLLSTAIAQSQHCAAAAAPAAEVTSEPAAMDIRSASTEVKATGDLEAVEPLEIGEFMAAPDDEPQAEFGSVTRDNPALVVFVADRSVEDPFQPNLNNACAKVRDELGKLVFALHTRAGGAVDVAVVSYGADAGGATEVHTTLEGGLQGKTFARSDELHGGALRVEESFREESNGVGGILRIPLNRIHLVELEAAGAATASPCFQQVRELVNGWVAEHPAAAFPPLIVHLTRGCFDPADIRDAAGWLADAGNSTQPPRLYHAVLTEQPVDKAEYCGAAHEIADARLQAIWHAASDLFGRRTLAEENPNIQPHSRGFVVNGSLRAAFEPLFNAIAD